MAPSPKLNRLSQELEQFHGQLFFGTIHNKRCKGIRLDSLMPLRVVS
jgi:hypothetical protein